MREDWHRVFFSFTITWSPKDKEIFYRTLNNYVILFIVHTSFCLRCQVSLLFDKTRIKKNNSIYSEEIKTFNKNLIIAFRKVMVGIFFPRFHDKYTWSSPVKQIQALSEDTDFERAILLRNSNRSESSISSMSCTWLLCTTDWLICVQ